MRDLACTVSLADCDSSLHESVTMFLMSISVDVRLCGVFLGYQTFFIVVSLVSLAQVPDFRSQG